MNLRGPSLRGRGDAEPAGVAEGIQDPPAPGVPGHRRPVVALVKSIASSISIGTGGSVGREGPIVQIGSSIGSTVGQAMKMSDDRVRNLVACGAAGGVAATFNSFAKN